MGQTLLQNVLEPVQKEWVVVDASESLAIYSAVKVVLQNPKSIGARVPLICLSLPCQMTEGVEEFLKREPVKVDRKENLTIEVHLASVT